MNSHVHNTPYEKANVEPDIYDKVRIWWDMDNQLKAKCYPMNRVLQINNITTK